MECGGGNPGRIRLPEEGPVYQRPIAAPAPRVESERMFQFTPEGMQLTENFKKLLGFAGDRF